MFKATGPQEAKNEHGIIVEIDGYVLRYIEGGHVLELGSEPGMPTSQSYQALFNVYFPTTLQWQPPHRDETITPEKSRLIEQHILEAMNALECEINFTLPMAS